MSTKSKLNKQEKAFKKRSKTSQIFRGMALNILTQLFVWFRVYVDAFIDFIFSLYWNDKRQAVPDLDKRHAILQDSAVELAKKIREKKLKSEDLVEAVVERIKAVNPILNAMTDERFAMAFREAADIDERIAGGKITEEEFKKKPFLGVPFTTKESNAVKDLLHTWGLLSRRHMRASEDAECVRLMKEAGGIAIAVTNVPELNKWQEVRNFVFGQTNNPYHTGRTTGGSSGGEAALMASYATTISICSDIGGSTRMPAFYCGLFGHNPTAGTTSIKGCLGRSGLDDTMAGVGPATRHAEDLAPLTKVFAGDAAHKLNLDRQVDVKKLRFFYTETSQDLRCSSVQPDLRKTMKRVVTKLTENAESTEKAPKPYYHEGFNYMFTLWRYWMTKEAGDFAALLMNNNGRACALKETAKKIFGLSAFTWAAIIKLWDDQILPKVKADWAENITKELREDLFEKLGSDGVLIFPSTTHPAPYHGSCFLRPYNFSYWGIFNVLRCPTTQVPLGLNEQGLPLGVQVVAAPYNDALCIAVAKYLEKEFGGFVPPCRAPN